MRQSVPERLEGLAEASLQREVRGAETLPLTSTSPWPWPSHAEEDGDVAGPDWEGATLDWRCSRWTFYLVFGPLYGILQFGYSLHIQLQQAS